MISTLKYDANKPTGAPSCPGFRRKRQRVGLLVHRSLILTLLTLHTEDWAQGSESVQKGTEAQTSH